MPDDLAALGADAAIEPLEIVSIGAPPAAIDAVYAQWHGDHALLWQPPAGPCAVATGAAVHLRASGAQRIAALQKASRRMWTALHWDRGAGAPAPRVWGGLSFAPGAADTAPWLDFGDASFVLPRLTFWRDGDRAWLQAAGRRGDPTLGRALAATRCLLERLPAANPIEPHRTPPCALTAVGADAWLRQVADILAAIGAGRVRKVVAALCARVEFERPPSVAGVLANLRAEAGPVWRFAFGRGRATFLGATPELLVRRTGERVESEALAGTLARSHGSGADLLASGKDRSEHQFVCDGIVAALAPICDRVDVPSAPAVRALSRLFHLATPIRGRLDRPLHVLELCARLHPTPATGGTPRKRALQMILATEASPRGWYAAPVGWFDAAGDGELAVGLRSGLLSGGIAFVHAGAGIVADSRADHELAEVRLKQRVLLRAFGLADE